MALDDFDKYTRAWTATQLMIWREKIERLKVVDTGRLHESFKSRIDNTAEGTTISMRFMRYGIYQALGVGSGYERDNGGDLQFLDPEYRRDHRLDKKRKVGPAWGGHITSGKPRKKRDWYSKKLYMSVMAMTEDLAQILAEECAHVVCDQLSDTRAAL